MELERRSDREGSVRRFVIYFFLKSRKILVRVLFFVIMDTSMVFRKL